MRIPVIPIAVVAILVGVVTALITQLPEAEQFLVAPRVSPLFDLDGVETDVAIGPGGDRFATIASGNLWFSHSDGGSRKQLTDTPDPEASPDWTPDGTRITFTRGPDTFAIDPETLQEELFLADATDLAWSGSGRTAFVRDRGLWVGAAGGVNATRIIGPNQNPDVSIRAPRFSPDGSQILFILSMLDLHGEVWVADARTGDAVPIIADRNAENPTSAEWVTDNRHVAYITDRGGGLAVWYADLEDSSLVPLTVPLMGRALAPLGIAVHDRRIVVPRHFIDSDIRTSDGRTLIDTPQLEFDPTISPRGTQIAYTVEREGRFEIWAAGADGDDPHYVTLGQRPRFSPNGTEIVFSRTDLDGNKDIWKVDARTGVPTRLTDAPAVDDIPDWSPDGRSIIFTSDRAGRFSLWSVPASGGQRLRLNEGGYAPRFSPDGTRIAYWFDGGVWTAQADGSRPVRFAEAPNPVSCAWGASGPVYEALGRIVSGGITLPEIGIWPPFDRLPDNRWLVASLDVEKTGLWAIDLVFTE